MNDFFQEHMLDIIRAVREHGETEEHPPEYILCLACASLSSFSVESRLCPQCGAELNPIEFAKFYSYSSDALRYGHQYKAYYSAQHAEGEAGRTKACLADLPEIYKFVAVAIISGVIGGASWDLTKSAAQKIIAEFSMGEVDPLERTEPTIDSAALDELSRDVVGYTAGLNHVEGPVSHLILEEIYADNTSHFLDELEEIYKLLAKPKKKEKNKKRAVKLQKRLMRKIIVSKLQCPDQLPQPEGILWNQMES